MNERQTATLIQERRPGAANKAIDLQRENPGWSWLKCCSMAKQEFEKARRQLQPNTTIQRPTGPLE